MNTQFALEVVIRAEHEKKHSASKFPREISHDDTHTRERLERESTPLKKNN